MPELRQNLATKEWVIIADDRAVSPSSLKTGRSKAKAFPADKDCAFCPGNEGKAKALYVHGEAAQWKLRVVANNRPALVSGAARPQAQQKLYRLLPGEGLDEVIVESPDHGKSLAELDKEQLEDVIAVYQERFRASSENMKVSLTMLFKNHGAAAGTSTQHAHSRLIGSSVVPSHIRHRMDEAQKYFEQNKECVVCRMNEEEKAQGSRLVAENGHFLAYVLFAALSPFHLWIVPKRHTASFADLTAAEANAMAAILKTVLGKLHVGLGDPDYNFVIQSTPQDRGSTEAFHWYLSLVVRLGGAAGFELGSGMFLNNVIPEEAAKFLQGVKG
ncbi:MAG: galactose-1-phosphate uridylyltransferase [Elusimicrobiota bacterium]